MSVTKLSVALDERVAQRARASAERQGLSLSAWLNRAASSALAVEDGLAAVAGWEAEHGALTSDELKTADRVLDSKGAAPKRRRRTAGRRA
jgi:hypothetical protein